MFGDRQTPTGTGGVGGGSSRNGETGLEMERSSRPIFAAEKAKVDGMERS